MRRKFNPTSVYYAVLLVALPLLYFVLYGRHGYSDTDHGFIQGLAWRTANGEVPYWNYIYVRPPLSPILHAIEMAILPDGLEVIGSRLLYYGTIWFSVLFGGLSLRYFYNFYRLGLNFWMFLAIAFVLSAHNFPPMPWHTLDGILLASLGAYLISRGPKMWKVGLGIIALILAALCKQPFILLPIVGIMASYGLWGRKQAFLGIAIFSLALLIFFISALLGATGEWVKAFWSQTTGVTSIGDLWEIGILKYLKAFGLGFGVILLGGLIWNRFHDKTQAKIGGVLGWIFVAGMVGLNTAFIMHQGTYRPPTFLYVHIMWCLGFVMAAAGILGKERGAWPLMILLIAAWGSSISWGYPVPALAFTPIIFGFVWFIREYFEFEPPKFYYPALLVVLLVAFFLQNRYPYRDAPRSEEYFHLGDVYPKLNHVHGGKYIYGKLADMKKLSAEYNGNFTVLPAMPQGHYLEGLLPPIQVDWAHNAEMNYQKGIQPIINKLNFVAPTVLMERDKLYQANMEGKYGSELARFVQQNWKKVKETTFFDVYQKE